MREHIAGVNPLSNGTGSFKKGANHPRIRYLYIDISLLDPLFDHLSILEQ